MPGSKVSSTDDKYRLSIFVPTIGDAHAIFIRQSKMYKLQSPPYYVLKAILHCDEHRTYLDNRNAVFHAN